MGSTYKRLALASAVIGTLIVSAAFLGSASSASVAQKSRVPSMSGATSGSVSVRGHNLKTPEAPNVVLYDQYDNESSCCDFFAELRGGPRRVRRRVGRRLRRPGWGSWTIDQVDAAGVYFNGTGPLNSVNVSFYSDASGLPGSQVATRPSLAAVDSAGSLTIPIPSAVTLGSGHYWVSVQANMDFATGGQWGWTDRTRSRTTKRPGRSQATASRPAA